MSRVVFPSCRVLALVTALAWMGAAGCKGQLSDTPEHAYGSFLHALQRGEAREAFDVLSTPARTALTEQARLISQTSGGTISKDPAQLAFVGSRTQPSSIKLGSQADEQHATLVVMTGEKKDEVKMVKEDGGWRVDLPVPVAAK